MEEISEYPIQEKDKSWQMVIAEAIAYIAKDKEKGTGYSSNKESAIPIDEKKQLIEQLSKLLK